MQEQLIVGETKPEILKELRDGLKIAERLGIEKQVGIYKRKLNYEQFKQDFQDMGFKVVEYKTPIKIEGREDPVWLRAESVRIYSGGTIPSNVLKALEEHEALFDRFEVWYPYRQKDPLLIGTKDTNPRKGFNAIHVLLGVWE
ncbi:hypothetical protein KAR91_06865 [Candidatus Pacearchaeota archaeon]|nr:hypothetical protein [Candidatus Pacearchaeota archaeon]